LNNTRARKNPNRRCLAGRTWDSNRADDKTNTLWVCQNSTGGRGGAPVAGRTALRSFDLKSGAAMSTYPFPTNGVCNDIAVASNGTVYATESFGNRIHRLRPGAKELDVWVSATEQLAGVEGYCRAVPPTIVGQPDATAGPAIQAAKLPTGVSGEDHSRP
jgi:hypothetical protein